MKRTALTLTPNITNAILASLVVKSMDELAKCFETSKDEFTKRFDINPINALQWRAKDVMLAQHLMELGVNLKSGVTKPDVDVQLFLRQSVEEIHDRLIRTKPWAHNSTCPVSNLNNTVQADAYTDFLNVIYSLEWEIELAIKEAARNYLIETTPTLSYILNSLTPDVVKFRTSLRKPERLETVLKVYKRFAFQYYTEGGTQQDETFVWQEFTKSDKYPRT